MDPFEVNPFVPRIALKKRRLSVLRTTALFATFFETTTAYRFVAPASFPETILQENKGVEKDLPFVVKGGKSFFPTLLVRGII